MSTLREIIYNIRTIIKDVHSDDIKFTDRNIAYWIKYTRNQLIRQNLDKGREISDSITQELNVNFDVIDYGKDKNIELGTSVLRSTNKIPTPLSATIGDLITSITGNDPDIVITMQSKNKATRNKNNKYGKKFPVAYLDQGYLYIKNCNFYIENVVVSGVFANPEDVDKFNDPDIDINFDEYLDKPYPIEDYMISMLNSMIKEKELNLYFQLQEDKVNDSQNNSN